MEFNQIVTLNVTKNDIISAIKKAKEQHFIDNLRNRHPNVAFDSKLRGYVGEIALKKWLSQNGINIETVNIFDDGFNMDIDFKYKGLDIELKTSLIPDVDKNLETVFIKRDIKLIKREKRIEDLKGDIHIQIYFKHLREVKDNWLKKRVVDLNSNDIEYIYKSLAAKRYINETFLFSWIDKDSLIKKINSLPLNKRTWGYAMRSFWRCPLKESFPPNELINYLKNRD